MTSMRMRLLFSLFFVHVLVRHIGGEAGVWGWGVMTSMHVHANATFVSLSCVHVLVRYIGGEGGVGGGGVMTSMRMRLLFSVSFFTLF